MGHDDFCLFAEWLLKQEPNLPQHLRAAAMRTVISRAYYGAFHAAIRFLTQMGITIPSTEVNPHKRVLDLLSNTGDVPVDGAIVQMRGLRDERNTADYRLSDKQAEAPAHAQDRLDDATDIAACLNTCRTNATRFSAVTAKVVTAANKLFLGKS
jgi:hypothetical protein